MYGLNAVQLIGHIGQDPEIRYTSSGVAMLTMSLATNESYKDQSGQLVERTEWHRLVAYRRLAELFGEYVKKGSKLYVSGKLQTRSWEDKEGRRRYITEVIVGGFVFLDTKGAASGQHRRDDLQEVPDNDADPPNDLPF